MGRAKRVSPEPSGSSRASATLPGFLLAAGWVSLARRAGDDCRFPRHAWVVYDETDTFRDHPSGWVSPSGPLVARSGWVSLSRVRHSHRQPTSEVSRAPLVRLAARARLGIRAVQERCPPLFGMQPKCQHSACSRILGSPGLVLVFGDRVFPSALKPPRWQREQRSPQADCHQADDQTQSPTGESECPVSQSRFRQGRATFQ